MSAKAVTDKGDGREAVLRAMQEAAENASGGSGGSLKGPPGTKGIVVLSNETSYIPEDKPKDKKHGGGGSVETSDEGSEASVLQPRNLSYSSQSQRALKSPAKKERRKRGGAAWPPNGEDDEEEEGEIHEDEDDDDDDSGSRHSYDGIDVSIDHVQLFEWVTKWTQEHGIPGVSPLGVFSTLCLDGRWHYG